MIIAVDIGTTNVKAILFDLGGQVLYAGTRQNETFSLHAGWSEQSPEAVYQHVSGLLQEVFGFMAKAAILEKPLGIVFSAAMHGLIAVDADGRPLSNLMLWSDTRTAAIAKEIRQLPDGGYSLYERTGVPIHPMSPLLKVIWLQRQAPELVKQTRWFLGIKEYVWSRLSGKFESDISCASATGFMNLRENQWDAEALKVAGIPDSKLPRLVYPLHQTKARVDFIPEDVPLIIGASDGALANLGAGAILPGQFAVTIGTSAAIRCLSKELVLDPLMRSFCYRLDENRCIVGGASNNGTNTLEWLRTSVFQSNMNAEDFANQAMQVPAGAEGLRFLPYLYGERAPLWDAEARASFEGIQARHTQAHFVRAVMEGVLFNLKAIAEVLAEKIPIQTIHANGGFARNPLWVSMLEDVFQQPVLQANADTDASALGAFLLVKEAL